LQNYVAEHVRFGFFFADLADIDELLHERLIFRGQTDLRSANHVRTAVADLDEIELVALDRGARQCCAHTATAAVFQTLVMNVAVCLQGGVLQTIDKGRVRIALRAFGILAHQYLLHGFDCHLAGHIARQCAAHAVGND